MPWREPLPGGSIIWSILGPYSFVRLSKHAGLDATDLGRAVGAAIGAWMRSQPNGFRLQLDEPCLGMRLDPADEALRDAAYDALGEPGVAAPGSPRASYAASRSASSAGSSRIPRHGSSSWRRNPFGCERIHAPIAAPTARPRSVASRPACLLSRTKLYGPRIDQMMEPPGSGSRQGIGFRRSGRRSSSGTT